MKRQAIESWSALNPLHYNEDREMIGHQLLPMDQASEGVFWCRVCGGHPDDPIHQLGWTPERESDI